MVYEARTFSTHTNNGEVHFLENIYMREILFIHSFALFCTLDTICAGNKDKRMAVCKNQLIKVFDKFLAPNIHHIEIMIYI